VLTLTVSPGVVAATVQGSRAKPYEVSIGFHALDERSWAQIESSLGAQAVHRAHLLAGEMPESLEAVVELAGATLFPRRIRDLTMRSSCPDIAVPCKHIAAAFYLLAERFDDEPFAILLWRGRSREQLLSGLDEVPASAGTRGASGGLERALEDLPALDVAAALDRFWLRQCLSPRARRRWTGQLTSCCVRCPIRPNPWAARRLSKSSVPSIFFCLR
jgi:uncharacterized Zn finger protein